MKKIDEAGQESVLGACKLFFSCLLIHLPSSARLKCFCARSLKSQAKHCQQVGPRVHTTCQNTLTIMTSERWHSKGNPVQQLFKGRSWKSTLCLYLQIYLENGLKPHLLFPPTFTKQYPSKINITCETLSVDGLIWKSGYFLSMRRSSWVTKSVASTGLVRSTWQGKKKTACR